MQCNLSFFAFCMLSLCLACGHKDKQATAASSATKATTKVIDTANFTQIKWQNEHEFFGQRKEGEVVTLSFNFKNVGTKPFVIEEVRPSCGCTIVDYPKGVFQPGQSGQFTAKYDSKGRGKGFVKKMVIIKGNFKESPLALSFEGTIK